MIKLAIATITYKRPNFLKNLLPSIAKQEIRTPDNYNIRLIIVDNDPSASAESVVSELQEEFPFPIVYSCEKEQGIPYARNRAVELSKNDDFLIFIDDDETAAPHWLQSLLDTQRDTEGSIVAGPVYRDFEGTPEKWLTKIKLFTQPQYPEGTIIGNTGTGNVLIKRSILSFEGPFDKRFAKTGGSDSVLFNELKARGHNLYWSRNADTRETVPRSRMTVKWVLQRSFRIGCTSALMTQITNPTSAKIHKQYRSGFFKIFKGLALLPFGLLSFKKHIIVSLLQNIYRGAGTVSGLWGYKYNEYNTIHGE